ncbi:diacylglycerol kinase family lipid kinase [Candidatus Pacearchaeota archaeon]|nr:diacylglycerol kinase family lipid kinase [Candidatus Pacearchaeota archaeon]
MKAKLIINPTAGKTKRKMPPILKWTFKKLKKRLEQIPEQKTTAKDIVNEVKKKCYENDIKLDISFTKYPKHAMKLAKNAGNKYDLVIVAGGDGTVNEVINGLFGSKATLVIIPFGSTNVLALELGIPFNVKRACDLIVNGKRINIDLGHAKTNQEERYFSMMLSVGFDASLINQIDSKFKKRWGKLAYPLAGIKHIFKYKWSNIHVKHKVHSIGYFVIISNSKCYGGEYQIADKANMKDGLLDLIVINRKKWLDIVGIVFSLLSGKLNTFLSGEYHQTEEAHIYSRKRMLVEVDGELIGTAPVKVKIAHKALKVMVKKSSAIV